jgi:arginase
MQERVILSAPSILGLKPSGVEKLSERLLESGLVAKAGIKSAVIHVPTFNDGYTSKKDEVTGCLNAALLKEFSLRLSGHVASLIKEDRFVLTLGGDCSILVGIMHGLKTIGRYGLIHIDAHADFYQPDSSMTGEVADMDLAIVTGRGPDLLTNMNDLRPYVPDRYVIQVGQRDHEQTKEFRSPDIRDSGIISFDLPMIRDKGLEPVIASILGHLSRIEVNGFWIHFDTDALSDKINPAVDYRLPGGLDFAEMTRLLKSLISTGKMIGMSVTIFNPLLDKGGTIADRITRCLADAFKD